MSAEPTELQKRFAKSLGVAGIIARIRHGLRQLELEFLRNEDDHDDRAPLPPDVLVDALQDRIVPASGRLLGSTPVRVPPPSCRPAATQAGDVIASRHDGRPERTSVTDKGRSR